MTPRVDDRANFQTGQLPDFVEAGEPEGDSERDSWAPTLVEESRVGHTRGTN
jgi:hypothetical protein